MSPTSPNNSAATDLLLAALQELKEMKFEVTLSVKPPGDPTETNYSHQPRFDVTKTEDLLPPVLTPKNIQSFLGISQRKVYEFLNSGQMHVARAGRMLYVSRAVFIEWLEGRSDEKEVKPRN